MHCSLNIGIGGRSWGGGGGRDPTGDVAEGVVAGKYQLLFFTPETFLNSRKFHSGEMC